MAVARAFFAIFTNVSFVEIIITQIKHPRAFSSWVMKTKTKKLLNYPTIFLLADQTIPIIIITYTTFDNK